MSADQLPEPVGFNRSLRIHRERASQPARAAREDYINLRGERTPRAYSHPVNLARFDRAQPGWMTSGTDLWWIPEHLLNIHHTPILTPTLERHLFWVDRRSLQAAVVGRRVS